MTKRSRSPFSFRARAWTGAFALSAAATVAVTVFWCAPARAESCTNDNDCKAHGTACGTDVCSWPGRVCVSPTSGSPGWCDPTNPSTCKCAGAGAHCVGYFCVNDAGTAFVVPPEVASSRGGGRTKWGCAAASGASPLPASTLGAWALAGGFAAARRRKNAR